MIRNARRRAKTTAQYKNDVIIQMTDTQYAFYKFMEYGFIFLLGGAVYICCELIYRGHSHWSMFIMGGLCLLAVGGLNEKCLFPNWCGLLPQALLGAGIITVLEFICGLIVNVWLKWGIWDYSNVPFNIMGQVCLPFYFIWVGLAALAIVVDDYIRYFLFGEEKPHYCLWHHKDHKH